MHLSNAQKRQFSDFVQTFSTPHGKRCLEHLEKLWGVCETREPEEEAGRPIDQTRYLLAQGMKRAYYKLLLYVQKGEELSRAR